MGGAERARISSQAEAAVRLLAVDAVVSLSLLDREKEVSPKKRGAPSSASFFVGVQSASEIPKGEIDPDRNAREKMRARDRPLSRGVFLFFGKFETRRPILSKRVWRESLLSESSAFSLSPLSRSTLSLARFHLPLNSAASQITRALRARFFAPCFSVS